MHTQPIGSRRERGEAEMWPPDLDIRTRDTMRALEAALWDWLEVKRFQPHETARLQQRRSALAVLFGQAKVWDAGELHGRLMLRLPGDKLARSFHHRLATPTRRMLMEILRRRAAPGSQLEEPAAAATGASRDERNRASSRLCRPETALMEHLGQMAARARNEAEAEAFIGALLPLAARVIPRAAPTLLRSAPALITGLAGLTRRLRSDPTTRPLVRAIPTILRNTARNIGRQTGAVAPRAAARTLAQQSVRVLGSPQQRSRALRTSRALSQAHSPNLGAAPGASGGQRPVLVFDYRKYPERSRRGHEELIQRHGLQAGDDFQVRIINHPLGDVARP